MRFLITAAVLLGALSIEAAARNRLPPATEAETTEAQKAYTACVIDRAEKADDGISDPISIGRIIASQCPSELHHMVDVMTQGRSNDVVRGMVFERISNDVSHSAASIVLAVRRKRATEAANPSR